MGTIAIIYIRQHLYASARMQRGSHLFAVWLRQCLIAATILLIQTKAICPCAHRLSVIEALHNATNGLGWVRPWNMSDPEVPCSLEGINCTSLGIVDDITSIRLVMRRLSGTVPAVLSELYHLSVFDLSDNSIEGTLPAVYANWTLLESFDVSGNRFTGFLPPEYSAWGPKLFLFDVYHNVLGGSLPELYSMWTNIIYFDVSWNRFIGTLPPGFGAWTSVDHVHINNNNFAGPLPRSYLAWVLLDSFTAENNHDLDGTLPADYNTWTGVRFFDVSNTRLSGTLPTSFKSWSSMYSFNVQNNSFSGTLPPEYSNWGESLWSFRAFMNSLTGTLPSAYSSFIGIHSFEVHYNSLSGELPPNYASWASIDTLRLAQNTFTGTIPSAWGRNMINLAELAAAHNRLTGTIPLELLFLQSLKFFSASFNNLRGTLPSATSSAPWLTFLDVQNNSGIFGELPSQLSSFGTVSLCGTQICRASPSFPLQLCLPADVAIPELSNVADVLGALLPYTHACHRHRTPLPSSSTVTLQLAPNKVSRLLANEDTGRVITSMIYASLLGGGGGLARGAVASMQRASSAIRLASLCNGGADSADGDADDIADNILRLSLDVTPDRRINSAAGAAVGNRPRARGRPYPTRMPDTPASILPNGVSFLASRPCTAITCAGAAAIVPAPRGPRGDVRDACPAFSGCFNGTPVRRAAQCVLGCGGRCDPVRVAVGARVLWVGDTSARKVGRSISVVDVPCVETETPTSQETRATHVPRTGRCCSAVPSVQVLHGAQGGVGAEKRCTSTARAARCNIYPREPWGGVRPIRCAARVVLPDGMGCQLVGRAFHRCGGDAGS